MILYRSTHPFVTSCGYHMLIRQQIVQGAHDLNDTNQSKMMRRLALTHGPIQLHTIVRKKHS